MSATRAVVATRLCRGLSIALASAALYTIDVGVADAHHAWNEIDTTKTTTLTGVVKSLRWENPHASLVLDTVDGATRVEWTVMMSGLARMEARGVHGDAIAVDKRLTIIGSPARGEPHVVRANRIGSDGVEYVLY